MRGLRRHRRQFAVVEGRHAHCGNRNAEAFKKRRVGDLGIVFPAGHEKAETVVGGDERREIVEGMALVLFQQAFEALDPDYDASAARRPALEVALRHSQRGENVDEVRLREGLRRKRDRRLSGGHHFENAARNARFSGARLAREQNDSLGFQLQEHFRLQLGAGEG